MMVVLAAMMIVIAVAVVAVGDDSGNRYGGFTRGEHTQLVSKQLSDAQT